MFGWNYFHGDFYLVYKEILNVFGTALVIGLIVMIAVFKLNPFITLLLTSLALAVVTGMPVATVVHSFEAGVGATLPKCTR